MNDKRRIEHNGRFLNAAVDVLFHWFYLAIGGISLLAMLPFMVLGRLRKKDKLMNTDHQRMEWLEDIVGRDINNVVELQSNQLINSQPGQEAYPLQIFSVPSQHQYGTSVRGLIDKAMEMDKEKGQWI